MPIKDDLGIYLITYNRVEKLSATLKKILSDSPIRDYNITILDNASTDATEDIIKPYLKDRENLKYIRNPKNIGISGNIIKAMELASKKWLWIICDDDDFDWSNWDEIEQALKQDYDIVHTTYTEGFRNGTYPYLINEEAFLPTGIYQTKYIDSITLQNAYGIASELLPHQAIGCRVINEKGKIFVPQKRCVIQSYGDKFNYIRSKKANFYPRLTEYQILRGYLNVYQLIEDEKIRTECSNVLCLGQNFKNSMRWFVNTNPNNNLQNIFDILLDIDDEKKKEFVSVLEEENVQKFNDFTDKLNLYSNNKWQRLFNDNEKLKRDNENLTWQITNLTNIVKSLNQERNKQINTLTEKINDIFDRPTTLQQIFSIKNRDNHKVWTIFGIKLKFKRKQH